MREGVEHFVGIDNGSDDAFSSEIEDLITSGKFTVIYDPLKHSQVRLYAQHCTPYLSGAVSAGCSHATCACATAPPELVLAPQ